MVEKAVTCIIYEKGCLPVNVKTLYLLKGINLFTA